MTLAGDGDSLPTGSQISSATATTATRNASPPSPSSFASVTMWPSSLLSLRLVPVLLLILPMITSSQSACPARCTCDPRTFLVDCQHAGLQRVPHDLPDPVGLKQLDLRNNDMTQLIAEIVSYPNLEFLDMSDNAIARVDGNVLDATPRLMYLYMRNNRIDAISTGMFHGLDALIELDLSHNRLTALSPDTFRDLVSLEDLNLSGNELADVSAEAFGGLSRLRRLHMEDNRLVALHDETFIPVAGLTTLNLMNNRLEAISGRLFTSIRDLRDLNLEDNAIAKVAAHAFSSGGLVAAQVSLLENLRLSNNKLSAVPSDAFADLDHLLELDLSLNPIAEIRADAFKAMPHLRSVTLSSMPGLTVIHDYAFAELAYLEEVHVHSNHKLAAVGEDAFSASPKLREVDLHANALLSMSPNLLEWDRLERLDLRYNHWRCDCDLQWLGRVLRHSASNATKYLAQELRCFSPPRLASKHFLELQPADFSCNGDSEGHVAGGGDGETTDGTGPKKEEFNEGIMIAIMGTVGGVLLIVVIILMYKYRSAYTTAYAPAMDAYVCRSPGKPRRRRDLNSTEAQRISVTSEDLSGRNLRSSLTSMGPRPERKLQRVRFADHMDRGDADLEHG